MTKCKVFQRLNFIEMQVAINDWLNTISHEGYKFTQSVTIDYNVIVFVSKDDSSVTWTR